MAYKNKPKRKTPPKPKRKPPQKPKNGNTIKSNGKRLTSSGRFRKT